MSTFRVQYRKKRYTMADAFRPDPGWGYRSFTADSEKIGTEDIEAVKTAAIQSAPAGYDFHSIEQLGQLATPTAETEGAGQ